MNRFICDGSYEEELKTYTDEVVMKYGAFSQAAQREIMCMADTGNAVAGKLYADMVFYKKLYRRFPYRDAFYLYLRCAGIKITEDGSWQCDGHSYPMAFLSVGYYLVNYKRESVLKDCEGIDDIEALTIAGRLCLALKLALSCVKYINAAEAFNLTGRILLELSRDEKLLEEVLPVIEEEISSEGLCGIDLGENKCRTAAQCADAAELFFENAAREGYVYASNSLAAREADRIVAMKESDSPKKYIEWLKLSADKYEPYAANRLGLFYMTGKVKTDDGEAYFPEYIDYKLAKQYFIKATAYPDSNSAWAYYNLIKYYPRDYTTNLELMNEHMDYIKELNPRVYDLAMEL